MIEVVRNDQAYKSGKGKKSSLDYTVHVEWDGGGVEEIRNPEWRMKGDEPDQQGRISHRDARVNIFHYWFLQYFVDIFLATYLPFLLGPTVLQILGKQAQFYKRRREKAKSNTSRQKHETRFRPKN